MDTADQQTPGRTMFEQFNGSRDTGGAACQNNNAIGMFGKCHNLA